MAKHIFVMVLLLLAASCSQNQIDAPSHARKIPWESRQFQQQADKELIHGQSYLPVYSHIYYIQENKPFYLTATISIRSTSVNERFFLLGADYYDTNGKFIKSYLAHPIYVEPLETIEFVIGESDIKGGSGANFIFDWATMNNQNEPLFEAVMISTYGQQGVSFTSRAIRTQ